MFRMNVYNLEVLWKCGGQVPLEPAVVSPLFRRHFTGQISYDQGIRIFNEKSGCQCFRKNILLIKVLKF